MAQDSPELAQIASEAADIARQVGHRPATAHLLLAIFTVPGAADELLRERGCDEDAILTELARQGRQPEEDATWFEGALDRARQLAADCGSDRAEGLHLLLALIRLSKSSAAQLLELTAPPVATLRTAAMSYVTGAAPRRRPPREEVKVTAAPRTTTAVIGGSASPRAPQRGTSAQGSTAGQAPAAPGAVQQASASIGAASLPARATASPSFTARAAPALDDDAGDDNATEPPPRRQPAPAAPGRWSLDPSSWPWLVAHGRNLTELAASHRLDAAIGRDAEVEEVLDILGKRRANNPVLVGEPGVGKTAIVEGLARRFVAIARDNDPAPQLLIELDVSGLVAGTALRGSFSERLGGIKDEVRRAEGRIVVFIDELHMLIGAGSTGEGPQDAANELKAALARGEFPCIGATTHDEFRKHVQGDPALERRFVPVLVREPSVRDAARILEGAASRYEEHHQVSFSPEALLAAAELSARYVRDRFLPDKAFAAIDLAGSRARREGKREVTRDDVARAVARMAGLPEERVIAPDGDRYLNLEARLAGRIVGHAAQLSAVAKAVRRNFGGFRGPRPLASFLFLGPPGVGKTETARALADELYPSSNGAALLRIDLSEYAEPHSVARLLGAPPGYVGYGEGGQLTEPVRRRPASVVLLDEIEKAHPSVLQVLLQILDEGHATDGRGRRVDFSSTVVVLTSNLGGSVFSAGGRSVGFGASTDDVASRDEQRALEAARSQLPPELWSRLDERLVFAPLLRPEVARIAELLLNDSARRLWDERQIRFRSGPGLVELLIDAGGFQSALGARPMRQIIQRLVESPLADAILAGRVRPGANLVLCAQGGAVEFRPDAP